MADVFVSFASQDRDRVASLVRLLEDSDWTVWWSDRNIRPGLSFQKAISDAMDEARCVVVCWTATSVASEWVFEEASEGKERGILVPVLFDAVRPPIGLRATQLVDLSGWDGRARTHAVEALLAAVGATLGRPAEEHAHPARASPAKPLPEKRQGVRRGLAIGATVAALAAFLGMILFNTRVIDLNPPPATSVAVLPFVDMSRDSGDSRIGDNLALELHTELGFIPGVQLSSRATSFTYRDPAMDVREVGRAMAVAYVVEGTVRKAGNRIRVTIQLVSVEDGYQIWSDVYERQVDGGFSAEIGIASEAVSALAGEFGTELTPTLRITPTVAEASSPEKPSLQDVFSRPPGADFPQFETSGFATIGEEDAHD